MLLPDLALAVAPEQHAVAVAEIGELQNSNFVRAQSAMGGENRANGPPAGIAEFDSASGVKMEVMRQARIVAVALVIAAVLFGQPKRILYVTTSAEVRHDCLPLSAQILVDLATNSGKLEVEQTEDEPPSTTAQARRGWACCWE